MKGSRHGVILDVIDRENISSQEMLRLRLQALGFDVTQATLSRDLKELGVVKRASDGAYQRPLPAGITSADALGHLRRTTAEFLQRVERSEHLGTVAGDDTILVICRDAVAAQGLVQQLDGWRSGARVRVPVLVQ